MHQTKNLKNLIFDVTWFSDHDQYDKFPLTAQSVFHDFVHSWWLLLTPERNGSDKCNNKVGACWAGSYSGPQCKVIAAKGYSVIPLLRFFRGAKSQFTSGGNALSFILQHFVNLPWDCKRTSWLCFFHVIG